jgi:hypothetical protein
MCSGSISSSHFEAVMEKERAPTLAQIHLVVRLPSCPDPTIHMLILN